MINMEEIKIRLSADLKNAIKERDTLAVKAIRSLMSAIDNAGAVFIEAPKIMPMAGGIAGATDGIGSTEVPRKELSDEEIQQIIQKEIDEITKTIELIKDFSRPEIRQLTEQIKILEKYKI
jgi:uncharacterized protein